MDIHNFILLSGAVHGILISVVFFAVSRKQMDIKFFSVVIFLISLYLFETFLSINGIIIKYPHLALVSYPTIYLIGPCFYLLSQSTKGSFFKIKTSLIHFVPFLVVILIISPFYFASAESKKLFLTCAFGGEYPYLVTLLNGRIFYFFTSIYCIASFLRLQKANGISISRINRLRWLKMNVLWFSVHMLLVLVILLVLDPRDEFYNLTTKWSRIFISLQLFVIGYGIMIKSSILSQQRSKKKGNYIHSKLDDSKKNELQAQLINLLEEEKIFLDAFLSAEKLAKKLEREVRRYRAQPFLDIDFEGVRQFSS